MWAYFFNNKIVPTYLRIFIVYTKWHFTLKHVISFENLDITTFETKKSYDAQHDTFLRAQTCHSKRREQYTIRDV